MHPGRGSQLLSLLSLLTATALALACEPALQEGPAPAPEDPGSVALSGGGATFPLGVALLLVELEAADALERTEGPDVPATAVLVPSSGPRLTLAGSFDPLTGALELSAPEESLSAVRDARGIGGSYSGTLGEGVFGLQRDEPGALTLCGSSTSSSGKLGALVLVLGAGGGIVGGVVTANGYTNALTGSRDGERILFGFGADGAAEGTLGEEGALNGSWTALGAEGSFSASVDRCPLP